VNTTLSPTATYVDAVHAELTDLPADDLADIVEDVRDHVEQVSAELGEDATATALQERLGTPAAYAAELRSAAGYPPPLGAVAATGLPTRSVRWLATWSLRIAIVLTAAVLLEVFFTGRAGSAFLGLAILAWLVTAFFVLLWWVTVRRHRNLTGTDRELPDVRWLRGELPRFRQHPVGAAVVETVSALRPAWWVFRAWIAVELLGGFFGAPWFPLPQFTGAPLLFVTAIVASVWLGRRAASHRQSSAEAGLVLVGNVVAVLGTLWVYPALSQPFDELAGGDGAALFVYPGAFREDGTPITNLYPYGADGRLLENVRMYDQDGRPFTSLTYDGCMVDEMTGDPDLPALNVFPRPSSRYDDGPLGPRCRELGIVPPLGMTLPGSPSDATPAPTPAPSETASPEPSPIPAVPPAPAP
jgi:hypothetical protein